MLIKIMSLFPKLADGDFEWYRFKVKTMEYN